MHSNNDENDGGFRLKDPILTAVMANRLDSIVREMTSTLMRTARSALINTGRDFSCSICTGDSRLISVADGLPVHVFGSHLQAASMTDLHGDTLAEGDAFLHNDPYLVNTHPGDHSILVPVFYEGEHVFTVNVKAHQADIGNSIPTTLFADARDVYHEGALIFPCVRIQQNYNTNMDIVRMCQARIRAADMWYGDLIASIGAARIAERRLKEFCAKYGVERVRQFADEWFNYSEQRMRQLIRRMPAATMEYENYHDPYEGILPEGIKVNAKITIKPDEELIQIDLRDNPDQLDCGLNVSYAVAISCAVCGVFNSIGKDLPLNAGSFGRIEVLIREGSVVGGPQFPHSCSVATTNIACRLVQVVGAAFSQLGDGHGVGESGLQLGAANAVIAGKDFRDNDREYINMLLIASNGGPASAHADGWVAFGLPITAGMMNRDSVEIDELKHPILIKSLAIKPGTGGAGRFRGAPTGELVFGPRQSPMSFITPADGQVHAPRGVRGGLEGAAGYTYLIKADGTEVKLPNVVETVVQPGEWIRGLDNGGGGYGDPRERDPRKVLYDVLEGYETMERANSIYGVAFSGSIDGGDLAIDEAATAALRAQQLAPA